LHWYELEVVWVDDGTSWQWYELTSYRLCRDLPMQSVPILRWGVLHTTLCDKVCQWLAYITYSIFDYSCYNSIWEIEIFWSFCHFKLAEIYIVIHMQVVSFTNKTDCHNIAEILLKVALNTITNSRMNLFRLTICIVCMYSINLFNELACVLLYIFQLI
jgi:hypothetical protein